MKRKRGKPLPNANREYKDSMFTALFSDQKNLRELYNALTGSRYGPETSLVITTLPDIFYRILKNDLSFLLGERLIILIEHQSTLNPNMPLRILLYVVEVYKILIDQKALYGKKVWIPRPEFYVLYNGIEELPDESFLNLSEAFEQVTGHERIELELRVKVFNINHGRNKEIMAKCEALRYYALFVAMVREELGSERELAGKSYEERQEALGRAVRKTIEYFVDQGILKEFIEKRAGEVINMLTTEFDITIAEQVWKEIAWEEGMAAGMEKGIAAGMEKGKVTGKEEGRLETQTEVLELIRQGYTLEQLKEKLTLAAGIERG